MPGSGADPATAGWTRGDDVGLPETARPLWIRDEVAGRAYGFLARDAHANARGAIHGGMLAVFMDHTLGLTVRAATGGLPVATVQLDLHYLAAGRTGTFVEGRGEVVRRTRSLVFVRGALTAEGAPVLSATGLWKIIGA